jgi:hypothetical protein
VAALRIYSETLPYEEVARKETVALLVRFGLEVVLAVRPWQLGELPKVARALGDVPLSVWPMLSDEMGRWANAKNADKFTAFVKNVCDVHEPKEILLDLEPPFPDARLLTSALPRGIAKLAGGGAIASDAFAIAETILADLVADLRARDIATAAAVWPLVALDPPGARGWQTLLGTPVDALAPDRVSVMMYTSILEGWSRGALRRRDTTELLEAATKRVGRRWGARGGISLGCVGTGAFEDEPTYRDPNELAEDVAIVRAAGSTDLSLFDLGGVLSRGNPEAWLGAFASGVTDRARGPERSRRVAAARHVARAMTRVVRRVSRRR